MIGRGNVWVNRFGFSPEEKQTQRLASHILTQSQQPPPLINPRFPHQVLAVKRCKRCHCFPAEPAVLHMLRSYRKGQKLLVRVS